MTLAAGRVPHSDRMANGPMVIPTVVQPSPPLMSENFAKDAIIAWFRGEFAAANAIIDALCNHLTQLEDCAIGGGGSEYETVFAAIHRRRLNWIPILQMQKFYPISDVAVELQKVVAVKKSKEIKMHKEAIKIEDGEKEKFSDPPVSKEDITAEFDEIGNDEVVDDTSAKGDLPESEIINTGSQAVQTLVENAELSCDQNGYEPPRDGMKITKGFTAKEPVKGHLVNVVRGLKLYEDVFTESELSKLSNFVDELRVAGRDGQLSGDTFILYNQSVKGNKREMIQLGVPIFGHIQDEAGSNCQKNILEPIPALLEGIIEHLIQWHIISESRRPNGCIINFFDEGEYSQPFLKPPHVDQPISTLLLSESTMAFGRTLVNDNEGNYRGPLVLSLKEGSLLVMRGNSSDVARHVMCSSPNKRVSMTFVRIRVEAESNSPKTASLNKSLALWHPGIPTPHPTSEGTLNGFGQVNVIPKWAPLVMLPLRPMVVSPPPRKVSCNGTGVFLPWTVGPKKPVRHLPPRALPSCFPNPLLLLSLNFCFTAAVSSTSFDFQQRKMSSNKDNFNMSDLTTALISDGDKADLVNALKNKLQDLTGKHPDVLESLSPQVRKRVEVLRELQGQHDELEAKFFEERAALEAKYQKLYQPLYTKRYDIVNGVVEVEQTDTETTETEPKDESADEKGVPNFWLTALKNNEVTAEEISERDEAALKFLKDIKWSRIENPKGFKLEFFFDTNPYFKNAVLTKTYHMIDEDEPILEKAIGTEIEWHAGKCLTQKILKKKPKKGSKNAKPITKTEQCESFFNFFSPPQVPEDEEDIEEDAAEELQNLMEQDYDIGSTIRDKIIPHAVSWFTGEAAEDEFGDMEEDDDEEEDEDEEEEEDEEEDDEDDEDDEEEEEKPKSRKKKGGRAQVPDGQQGERPPECKQQ